MQLIDCMLQPPTLVLYGVVTPQLGIWRVHAARAPLVFDPASGFAEVLLVLLGLSRSYVQLNHRCFCVLDMPVFSLAGRGPRGPMYA